MGMTHPRLNVLLGWIIVGLLVFDIHRALAQEPPSHLFAPSPARTITVTRGTLSEPTLEVNRGDKVIWLVRDQPVTIAFQEEGTSVFLTCASSTHLEPGEGGTYLSAVIPPGGKVSLCFIEPGIYEYVVSVWHGADRIDPRRDILTGTIVVK